MDWKLDHKEGWAPKSWCFRALVLELTNESPLDSKEIKPVNPEGNKSTLNSHWKDWCWCSNTLAIWCRYDSLEKILVLGIIESRRRRGQEDEMVGWHYQLNAYEFEQTLGDSEGQGSLACSVHGITKSPSDLATDNNRGSEKREAHIYDESCSKHGHRKNLP